jgi:hypothetical protein
MFAEKLAQIKTPSKTKIVHCNTIIQSGNTRVKEIKSNQVLFFYFLIPNLNLLLFSDIYCWNSIFI